MENFFCGSYCLEENNNFRDFCGIHLASEKMGSGNIGGQQCSAYTQCGKSGKERYSAVSRNCNIQPGSFVSYDGVSLYQKKILL